MKTGLAVLPMDVWADVFVYPWISRQQLAQIVDRFRERAFAEKLQKYLHDPRCGKHTLHHLQITSKPSFEPKKCKYDLRKRKIPECRASFAVSSSWYCAHGLELGPGPDYRDFEFPEHEMPENIIKFKHFEIRHLDDQVLNFLHKIKPLFTNVFLDMGPIKPAINSRILFSHLFPLLTSIRGISCDDKCINFLERHFPETLALSRELDLFNETESLPVSLPSCLNWLNAPQNFDVHGPRFFTMLVRKKAINGIVAAVRNQFLAATTSAIFVIYIEFYLYPEDNDYRIEEFNIENATNEQLAVRNATFKTPYGYDTHYVEVLRYPTGAIAKIRGWIEERAYYEKFYNHDDDEETKQIISMGGQSLTIGHISKKKKSCVVDQDKDQSAYNEK